jgi:D-tyrosyl-tRNA(Tyr) deacylase
MILLIQRVLIASVHVDGENVGSIGKGLLAFVAIEPEDD